VVLSLIVTRKRSDSLSRPFRNPILCWFGKYSYGMYVVQLPLVTFLPIATFVSTLGLATMGSVLTGLAYLVTMVALTCAIAYVSFHQFENRFLNLKRFF
jgi:peptidoglycan/LPS O-acetylase OafA/YrhL